MKIQLSDHFTYKRLLRFTFPSIVMMLFTSIYSVVDGLFISNIVGETAFAAINLIFPYCMVFSALGSLFGVGGSALVAMVKGQGNDEKGNRIFSMLVWVMIVLGFILMGIAQLFLPAAARLLGATDAMYEISVLYGRIFLITLPAFLLQYCFHSFFITAEKPKLGLAFTVAAGVCNMILDWLFVAVFRWGVAGAAAATCIGQCVGGIGGLVYFIVKRDGALKLVKPAFMPRELGRSASNGMADCIANVAMSLVNMVFNLQLMKYLGEYGVAAFGIIMYVNFVFVAVYLGYSMGVAPVISYHFGAGNREELRGLFKKSMLMVAVASLALTALALATARPVASVFAGYDPAFLDISVRALRLYSLSYFLAGFNMFSSNLFAALNNGPVSGLLSGLRIFVFQIAAVLLLPLAFGSDGIWLAMLAAELCVLAVTLAVLAKYRVRYGYV